MSQPLPIGGFHWVDIKPDKISKLAKHKSKGYLLEVDVRYPKELHDSHNDLPFMCERMKINGVEKLIPNLYDKKRYVIHIRDKEMGIRAQFRPLLPSKLIDKQFMIIIIINII